MYRIVESDRYWIIMRDGVEICKVSKINKLEDVKKWMSLD